VSINRLFALIDFEVIRGECQRVENQVHGKHLIRALGAELAVVAEAGRVQLTTQIGDYRTSQPN
jgi:hypothetical protein